MELFLLPAIFVIFWSGMKKWSLNRHPPVLCLQEDPWVTMKGTWPLLTHTKNCTLIEVTEEEVENVVKHIPKLDTLVSPKVSL